MVAKGTSALMYLENEIAILETIDHGHIVKLYEVMESPKKLYLVLELAAGGTVADLITGVEERVRKIFI